MLKHLKTDAKYQEMSEFKVIHYKWTQSNILMCYSRGRRKNFNYLIINFKKLLGINYNCVILSNFYKESDDNKTSVHSDK